MYSIDKSITDIIAVINNRIAATTPPAMAPPDFGADKKVVCPTARTCKVVAIQTVNEKNYCCIVRGLQKHGSISCHPT